MLEELRQIAGICDDWGATLIVADHYHLLDRADVQGVHIENMEADFKSIRAAITDERTLGASANSIEDIQRISDSGAVDYIGCGPFHVTKTKPNNYPLLGPEGYRRIIREMQKMQISIPLLAVGGIKTEDVEELLSTGIWGIAVSSAVNLADDPGQALKDFYKKIY